MKPNLTYIWASACAAFLPAASLAATLTTVPMQGGMIMPMISFHAEHRHLHVMMPQETAQLTPLLVSHPGDRFDPADPWFDDLDPSRRGLSFSRRYGFMMDAHTDPLPPGQVIVLRKVEGPPELGFYRYSATAPKAWEPIFGTAGSPATLRWNGMMFHPAVTAPPGTNSYRATFEAYLMDEATGEEVHHSSSGPFELVFTNVPDGRPELDIELKVAISWPPQTGNYVLEQAGGLNTANWRPVSATPIVIDGRPTVLLKAADRAQFYRLRSVP